MSARTSFCALAVAAAITWLLLPARQIPAQPPAGESTDQRLRRIEEKIDKLTTAISEFRVPGPKSRPVTEHEAQFIMNAFETLKNDLERRSLEYEAFSRNVPSLLYRRGSGGRNIYQERLAKIEARRGELQIKMIELQEELGMVNAVLQKETATPPGNQSQGARALLMLLKRKGVDLGGIRKRSDQSDAKDPNDVELLKVYGDSLTAEIESAKAVQRGLDGLFENVQKEALELMTYEVREQRLKEQLDSSKRLFEQILQRAQEMKLRRQ
jgi:hypothetical protein